MTSTTRSLRVQTTRGRVLDAATELFLRNGLHATTTDMVAQRAGLSRGTVQRLYPRKRILAAEVTERVCRRAIDRMHRRRPRDIDDLIVTLTSWAHLIVSRPRWISLYIELRFIDDACPSAVFHRRARLRESLSELLDKVDACDPSRTEATAEFLLTIIIGMALQRAHGAGPDLADIRSHIGLVVRGAEPR
ncbi:TetR/AcrR family transcriptional regulator [Nocardia sp. NPDC049220]|uniref:TetR/AcrR family transcriptional regulator n=1 Tax=Nocardia sp. NPDC049220 TaxID=3155273 RepID=UPI0033CF075F